MLSRILSFLMVALLLAVPGFGQESADLPADPQGQLVDRMLLELVGPNGTAYFYAVLTNQGGQSFLDIYKGLPWKRIHHWPVEFQGEKVEVQPNATLMAVEEDGKVSFFWREFVGYREGAVHMALVYDRATGKFSTAWSD